MTESSVADYSPDMKKVDGTEAHAITSLVEVGGDPVPARHPVYWYRGVMMQIIVVGCVFMCAPGMYNALANLGAGGLATPYWNNATAAAGYIFMAFCAVFGGVVVSKLGDGFMYAIEGPIVVGYPEPERRGFLLGIWVALRNAGPVIGGAIILAINHSSDSTGAVSLTTYVAIIAIMCCGPFISLLISRPERVQRRDGVKIVMRKTGWMQCLREWWTVASSKNMYMLYPMFFCSWFSTSYIGTLQTIYFTVRTRSLFAFTIPFADIVRGIECAGQAVAYGVKSSATNNYISVGLNMGLIAISLPTAFMIFWRFGGPDQPRLNPVLDEISRDGEASELEKAEKA
ncbi:hypothetical protein RQP46_009225 [Phenoliferia psychrophenolica]